MPISAEIADGVQPIARSSWVRCNCSTSKVGFLPRYLTTESSAALAALLPAFCACLVASAYPSETFRVLKDMEIRLYGENRTRRLVLAAWDGMQAGAP